MGALDGLFEVVGTLLGDLEGLTETNGVTNNDGALLESLVGLADVEGS